MTNYDNKSFWAKYDLQIDIDSSRNANWIYTYKVQITTKGGCRGLDHDHMVVGFAATCAISTYNH